MLLAWEIVRYKMFSPSVEKSNQTTGGIGSVPAPENCDLVCVEQLLACLLFLALRGNQENGEMVI